MKQFAHLAELGPLVGTEVAVSDWVRIDQRQIDQFAEATGDRAWIHTDPQRAAAGPFGAPVAHGFLTLSLIPMLAERAIGIGDVAIVVNYGLNRVRFTAPVPVDSRLRARFVLKEMLALQKPGVPMGAQATWTIDIEREATGKPVCVAEFIVRYYL